MSIAIALGVTTPETPYTDMAAGSDPESVEASPAVNEKTYSNHSCGSAQNHGYRGLPYAMQQSSIVCCQDHNYGAPPPPTPPASPLSQTIIPRLELNGALSRPRSRFHTNDPDNSADSDSSSEEEGAVPSGWCQCQCRLTSDRYLIKCESCRGLDRRKGLDGQYRKPDNVSGESSATESGDEEVSAATVSYTATQHTPTSITLTVNRVKRSKAKKRKKSTEKTRAAPKAKKVKSFREGSRKSLRMKNSTSEASVLDENTAEGWETRIRQWTDQYEEAQANQYSADVQTLLQLHHSATKSSPNPAALAMDTINRTELACNNTVLSSQMQLQLGRVTRVQKHRKILRAARDLEPDTLIIEYRGKVMLKQQFEVNGHFFKKPYPFVLFYSKFNEVEMCVDARTFGNDARFIRRSCTPNAEVRHMIAEGMIHLCIYAVTQISKDTEVTIGFDYEFNSCNYKVDCACHKGNQNCPVQKHNQNPSEALLPPPQNPLPTLPGAETRRRRARRKELEGSGLIGSVSDDSNQLLDEHGEHGTSEAEEGLIDGVKQEEGQEEVDETGAPITNRRSREDRKAEAIMHVFENLERRRKRVSQGTERAGLDDLKQEGVGPDEGGASSPTGANPGQNAGLMGGVSTRRTSFATDPVTSVESEKPSSANLVAPKPPPARPKQRPKSRISRNRASSAQRARRQRQALLAQQAAEAGAAGGEEGGTVAGTGELGLGDGALGTGQPQDGESYGVSSTALGSKTGVRCPKTKKYLVTEWLNDKAPDRVEEPIERPLRITTDPTVLATTLNMLPGLSHSPLICTTPKHYIRFGSPFNPERRRRPLVVDPAYGSCKKRWIKQAQDESMSSLSMEDGTESNSSHQSNSSSTASRSELVAPFKKRKSKYAPETVAPPSELLLRPLSPITPPLPSEPSESLLHPLLSSCSLYLGAEERQNGAVPAYSPLPSLPASRCNTPLQFENISSPEASPVHRPESLSPEPCLRPDFDTPRITTFPELSVTSGLGSPAPPSDDFPLTGPESLTGSGDGVCHTPAPVSNASDASLGSRTNEAQVREQVFRTEFNLIYTCSPLNANLTTGPVTDRRHSQSEGSFSPAESYFSSVSGQGVMTEPGSDSFSPYPEPQFGSGTPPHTSNPPQKKKRAMGTGVSQLPGLPSYQALAVRREFKPGQNMVSLLEYRKRKQGTRDPEPVGSAGGTIGTPVRTGSLCQTSESPGGPRSLLQPPASPHSSFSSPAHQPFPQIEEVSPPDLSTTMGNHSQTSSHWMVPTLVERLREGQGVLERVLRGNMKMERILKRSEGGASEHGSNRDKDIDGLEEDRYALQSSSLTSPMMSPQRYSPTVHPHQVQPHLAEPDLHLESSTYHQQSSSSPFHPSFSSSPSPSSSSVVQGYHPSRLGTPASLAQDVLSSSAPPSVDSRHTGRTLHHHSRAGGMDLSHLYSDSHHKASLLNSSTLSGSMSVSSRGQGHSDSCTAISSQASHASSLAQSPTVRNLKAGSPNPSVLQASSRLLSASGTQHYPQRHLQQPPMQGSGVRTHSGTY
ncbi:histone-lysine N-methyltransferase SETD5 isoform X2 [Pangasianodon hypophthalmus]|uniref:histone-lysine N-methyltransferase SETD5 isoform X2 n=1 Tax=Pangasianodon hypophthalmus TaxID=310915 RepID=UPI0023074B6D|nr:histone-lysine N-methyltransferase SETD5 isoform X2 [Pangasianodon hypophthalmus]